MFYWKAEECWVLFELMSVGKYAFGYSYEDIVVTRCTRGFGSGISKEILVTIARIEVEQLFSITPHPLLPLLTIQQLGA